jgi:hypothetical protein
MAEGLEQLPDGRFQPPMPLTGQETLVRNGNGELSAFGERPTMGGPVKPVGIYVARFRNLKGQPPAKTFFARLWIRGRFERGI